MAACEKCWADAKAESLRTGRWLTEVYRALLKERADNPCTPEEQCGDVHALVRWPDGRLACRCGKVMKGQPDG